MTAARAFDELWPEVGVDPVKVALPAPPQRKRDDGLVGFTLRAYRPASQITPTEAPADVEDDPFATAGERPDEEPLEEERLEEERLEEEPLEGEPPGEEARDEERWEEETWEEAPPDEEVPLFLSHQGRLLLFGSPRSLVTFVRSSEPHDLRQLPEWSGLAKRIRAEDVAPADEDTYELDLVVENLRGGQDAWDLPLLVSAGEFARDAGYALRMSAVVRAMSPGSPLDDLDETMRAVIEGGLGGMLARRRLRRFGVQQASLGWRNVIGKISAAVDWRE